MDDIDNIKLCCELSKDAYSSLNYNEIVNDHTDTYCFLKIINDDLYIAFRGSESIKDFLYDAQIAKQVFPYGNISSKIKVHEGFIDAYSSIRNNLLKKIFCYDYNNIFITGHSLGGALALLNLVDIQYNFNNLLIMKDKKVFCYTFGQPKVGNDDFCNSVKRRIINNYKYVRIMNGLDIVTMFPKFGYDHCGEIIKIGNSPWYKLFSVSDHYINNYIKSINEEE